MRLGQEVPMLALLLTLSTSTASASEHPLTDGLAVGVISAGSEAGAGLALGTAGVFLGAASCSPQAFECYSPLAGGVLGLGVGVGAGGPLGATLGAHVVHVRAGRVAGLTLATEGVGVGLTALGIVTESGPVSTTGLVVAAVGMPVVAGIAAATGEPTPRRDEGPALSIAPVLGKKTAGLTLSGRF